jgi:glutathione S-transferase
LSASARILDDQLATHDFVCGPQLTLADLAIAAPLMYAAPAALPLDACFSIQRWHARIREFDSWNATEPNT